MQQLHIFYSGDVQNIGFRYRAKTIADSLKITGWVRNLSDGRVELIIQGDKETLSEMKNLINNQFYGHITKIETKKETMANKLLDFKITPTKHLNKSD